MNYRPYPDVDRALAQLERRQAVEPASPTLSFMDEVVAPLQLADWQRTWLDAVVGVTHLKRSGKSAITEEAVKAGEHVHVAGRDGVQCAGEDQQCPLPRIGRGAQVVVEHDGQRARFEVADTPFREGPGRLSLTLRLADEAQQQPHTNARPESCAHCGKNIQRVTGTLAAWWVHNPGGNTVCFPQQAASSPRATPFHTSGVQQDDTGPVKESTRRYAQELRSNPGTVVADGHTGWECDAGASLIVEASTPGPGKLGTHHGVIYACASHRAAAVERITGAGYVVDPRPAPPGHRWNPWPCGHVTAHDAAGLAALAADGAGVAGE